MGILDDYDELFRAKQPQLMPPGLVPPVGPYHSFNTKDWLAQQRAAPRGMDFGTGSPGFPGVKMDWKPTGDTPDNSAAKLQDRLGPGTDTSAFDIAQTFSPNPIDGAKPEPPVASLPPTPAPPASPQVRTAAPAPLPPARPVGIGGETPVPSPRPAGLLANVPLPPARPTGIPTPTPPPSLTADAPLPPARPAGLGDTPAAPAPTPPSITAPTPPPIIPTAAIGSPIADFGKGGEFGNVAMGDGSDDLGQGLGGDLGNGSDDLAFAGADAGGETVGDAGGGGFGGIGGILGAIGGIAKAAGGGGGGDAKAPAPPVPVAKAPQLAPLAGDPAMAKRAQGAQQIMSGLLADPSLIDPRKRQLA